MSSAYKTIWIVLEVGFVIFVLGHPLFRRLVPRLLRWNDRLPAPQRYPWLSRLNQISR
jgi:hypothetical protein